MGSLPVLRQAEIETDWNWYAVSVCERAAAVILLLLTLPLLVVCALSLAILSRRTPLIAHRRVGWRGARWRAGAQERGGSPRALPPGTFLPPPFHRRASAVVARDLGRNVAGGGAAPHQFSKHSPFT